MKAFNVLVKATVASSVAIALVVTQVLACDVSKAPKVIAAVAKKQICDSAKTKSQKDVAKSHAVTKQAQSEAKKRSDNLKKAVESNRKQADKLAKKHQQETENLINQLKKRANDLAKKYQQEAKKVANEIVKLAEQARKFAEVAAKKAIESNKKQAEDAMAKLEDAKRRSDECAKKQSEESEKLANESKKATDELAVKQAAETARQADEAKKAEDLLLKQAEEAARQAEEAKKAEDLLIEQTKELTRQAVEAKTALELAKKQAVAEETALIKKQADEKAAKEAAELAKKQAEEKAAAEAAALAQKQAEEKAIAEAAELAKKQAEEKAIAEAAELAKKQAEEKAAAEEAALIKKQAEEQAAAEAAALAQKQAEELAATQAAAKVAAIAQNQAEEKAIAEASATLTDADGRYDLNLDVNMTVDNHYKLYLSNDDSVLGSLIGQSNRWSENAATTKPWDWQTPEAWSVDIKSNSDKYFLHVVANDEGVIPGFLGSFTLNGSDYVFANNSQTLLTNTTDWTVHIGSFGGADVAIRSYGTNGVGPWGAFSSINSNSEWIWSNDYTGASGDIRYFSSQINLIDPMLDLVKKYVVARVNGMNVGDAVPVNDAGNYQVIVTGSGVTLNVLCNTNGLTPTVASIVNPATGVDMITVAKNKLGVVYPEAITLASDWQYREGAVELTFNAGSTGPKYSAKVDVVNSSVSELSKSTPLYNGDLLASLNVETYKYNAQGGLAAKKVEDSTYGANSGINKYTAAVTDYNADSTTLKTTSITDTYDANSALAKHVLTSKEYNADVTVRQDKSVNDTYDVNGKLSTSVRSTRTNAYNASKALTNVWTETDNDKYNPSGTIKQAEHWNYYYEGTKLMAKRQEVTSYQESNGDYTGATVQIATFAYYSTGRLKDWSYASYTYDADQTLTGKIIENWQYDTAGRQTVHTVENLSKNNGNTDTELMERKALESTIIAYANNKLFTNEMASKPVSAELTMQKKQ